MTADLVSSLDVAATRARIKAVSPYHAKTFQWLYDHQVVTFSDWLQDPRSDYEPIYWIQGLPGSGKSTLMKFAMLDPRTAKLLDNEDETAPRYVLAGFFFHDRGSTIQKSISGMFQGLLHSILRQAPRLRVFVHPIYTQLVDAQNSKTPKWDPESLQLAFEAITQQREVTTRLCIFLDALDEHLGDNEQLVSLMSHLVSHTNKDHVKVKFCLASRPWDTFVNNFSKCPGFKIHEHTFGDILAYASSKLHDASPIDLEEESSAEARSTKLDTLSAQIAEQAHGVFIWVRIVVEEIANGVRSRTPYFVLLEALAQMPKELKDLYEHTLERIEIGHAEEAFVMLQIAICASSPLPLTTFVNVTSFTLWAKYSAPGEESKDDMIRRVVSRSGGLLEPVFADSSVPTSPSVLETSVQFIHQTVKEYIQNRKDNFGLRRSKTGGNGFEYLLRSAVACWENWANGIGLEAFEYATLARLAGTPIATLTRSFLSFITEHKNSFGMRTTRLDWWLEQKVDEPPIRFYTHDLFPALDIRYHIPRFRLQCLVFVAGFGVLPLDGVKDVAIIDDGFDSLPREVLVCIATIGPNITSAQVSRRDLLSSVVDSRGIYSEQKCFIPRALRNSLGSLEIVPDALVLLIIAKGRYEQDESERISAMRFLLDCGANPNCSLLRPGSFSIALASSSSENFFNTAFMQAIKQESAEVVRLFGHYGAKVPDDVVESITVFWRRLPRPSDVFQEVRRIIFKNDTDSENMLSNTGPEILLRDHVLSGAAVFCGTIGMAFGASGVTANRVTARERWHRVREKFISQESNWWAQLARDVSPYSFEGAVVGVWKRLHPEAFNKPELDIHD